VYREFKDVSEFVEEVQPMLPRVRSNSKRRSESK
jgi:hypothetical protein